MDNVHLSTTIKALCKSQNITVKKLLEDCRVSRNFIYDLEKKGQMPSIDKLEAIADYLDCSVDYLLGRKPSPEIENNGNIELPLSKNKAASLKELYEVASQLPEKQVLDVLEYAQFKKQAREKIEKYLKIQSLRYQSDAFDIDFNRDENRVAEGIAQRNGQLWIMKKAKQEYGVDKLIFSVWSAPAYMKSNGSTSQGFLKRGSYQAFADYLSNFCDAYTAAGLPVYAISPANEPEYAASWNSCLWLPGTTTLGPFIVNNLGPKLRQTHPETRIIFGENAQWSAILGFIMGSKNYVRDILNLNPKITNFPVIAAGHGYVDPVTGKDPAIEPFSKAESKGIPVWLTEISDPTESYDATMTSGLKWAKKFHRFLCEANTGAIVWWAGAIPDGGTTEGLINIEKNRVDYEVTKRCEVFGNFSRYIPVGSKRISAQYDFEQGYMVSGYKYGDNGYTVVAINPADHEVVISLALESAQVSGALQGYVTDDTRKWEPVEAVQPADGVYTLTLPARSVVSYTGTVLSSSSL